MHIAEGRVVERILLKSSEHVEIRYSDKLPSPGDLVRSDGRDWVVDAVVDEQDVIACVLVPAQPDLAR